MKIQSIIVVVLSLGFISLTNVKNDEEALRKGKLYCVELMPKVETISKNYNVDAAELLSIVYPETCRFSQIQDQVESSVLGYFYVKYGSDTSDFSIGHFQMKPSFVEGLESYINENEADFRDMNWMLISDSLPIENQRAERFERLSNEDWQIKYLIAFYKIVSHKFSDKNCKNTNSKISFYSKCFNAGLLPTSREVEDVFCNGPMFRISNIEKAEKFEYSELAVGFYQSLIQ